MRKICVNLIYEFNQDFNYLLNVIKDVGFDGISINWERNQDFIPLVNKTRELGLYIEYIHGPFYRVNELWEKDSVIFSDVIEEMKECILFAHKINVNKIVAHAFIGFDKHEPNDIGVNRFIEIIEFAKKYNITICLENVEGEEYLELLTQKTFPLYDNVAFCLDTGHELCYNRGKDQLALYGHKLAVTHINDNLGVRGEKIHFLDDLHYIPGDGVIDLDNLIERLIKCDYQGNVSFELKIKHDGKINENYYNIGAKEYYTRVFKIGEKIKTELK